MEHQQKQRMVFLRVKMNQWNSRMQIPLLTTRFNNTNNNNNDNDNDNDNNNNNNKNNNFI